MKGYNSKRPANVSVEVRDGQSITSAIKKFMKKVKRSGIIEQYRKSLEYEKPSDKRKRKARRREKVLKKLRQNRKWSHLGKLTTIYFEFFYLVSERST